MFDSHDDRGNLVEEMALHLIAAYGWLIKALSDLPLPIEVPPVAGKQYSAEVRESLIRVVEILSDVPMGEEHRERVRAMAVDWIIGSDHLFALEEDWARWKAEAVVSAIDRLRRTWKRVQILRDQE